MGDLIPIAKKEETPGREDHRRGGWSSLRTQTDADQSGGSRVLGVKDICRMYDVSVNTVRRWIADDLLPAAKSGREYSIAMEDAIAMEGRLPTKTANRLKRIRTIVKDATAPVGNVDEQIQRKDKIISNLHRLLTLESERNDHLLEVIAGLMGGRATQSKRR